MSWRVQPPTSRPRTLKHPSPSTYPEMYDGDSSVLLREPAVYCLVHRFATFGSLELRATASEASPRRDQSLRGHTAEIGRGLPTALPAGYLQPVRVSPL